MPDQLSTIRSLVLDRLGASSNDPLFDPSVVDRTINVSNKRLGRVTDWPWLLSSGTITQAASDSTFDLTTITNYRHTKYVANGNDKLTYKTPQAFIAVNTLTGPQIAYYTIIGNTMHFSPVPTGSNSLSHVYILDENDLLTDGDTPLLPSGYTELLVLATLPALAIRKGDNELLNMAKREYREAVMEALDEVRRTRQNPSVEYDAGLWATG